MPTGDPPGSMGNVCPLGPCNKSFCSAGTCGVCRDAARYNWLRTRVLVTQHGVALPCGMTPFDGPNTDYAIDEHLRRENNPEEP